jgi:peptidoglycan/LPS O-acetylase OafA/YrhL
LATVEPEIRVGTAVLISLTLSALLFRYVERPTRHGIRIGPAVMRAMARLDLPADTRIEVRREASS